jgi:two-component system response regulator RpaA
VKNVLTTGQIAKICEVAPRTATKWCDDGLIKGCYRLPGSKDRRIPRASLIAFMQQHNLVIPEELVEQV